MSEPAYPPRKLKVVVAEDEVLLRLMVSDVLRENGFQVFEARDAAEAISILRTTPVDVVITDLHMRGVGDGMEVASHVRAHCPGVSLLLTAGTTPPLTEQNSVRHVLHQAVSPRGHRNVDQAPPRDSQPPRRCKVGVNLPAYHSKPVAVETVLVLDSDVLVRMPIARYLRDCGYRVLEAANVDEAMTVLLKDDIQVDVVLSDVEMPGSMNGFAFAQWARSVHPGLQIVLSGTPRRTADAAAERDTKTTTATPILSVLFPQISYFQDGNETKRMNRDSIG